MSKVEETIDEMMGVLKVSCNNNGEGFPNFAGLSYEMRALIWKEAIQSPRVVEVEGFLMLREPLSDGDEPGVYDLRLSVTSSKMQSLIPNDTLY